MCTVGWSTTVVVKYKYYPFSAPEDVRMCIRIPVSG